MISGCPQKRGRWIQATNIKSVNIAPQIIAFNTARCELFRTKTE